MLHFKTFGQGKPVIILHGLFGSLDNWQSFAKQLSNRFCVFTPDLRNHGKSFHADLFDYETLADDLKNFMETEWLFEAHIIGHSMGGKTAMRFAMDNPSMVNSLTVLDIAPKAYAGGHELFFQAMNDLNLQNLRSRSEAETALSAHIKDPQVLAFLLKNLDRTPQGTLVWKINLPALHKAYPKIMAAIHGEPYYGRTLFVSGGASNYITNDDYANIANLFPNAQFEVIEKAGHWLHADAPHELLTILTQFLEQA